MVAYFSRCTTGRRALSDFGLAQASPPSRPSRRVSFWWPLARGHICPSGSIGRWQSWQIGRPPATASAQDSLSERACSRVKRHDNVGGIDSSSPASTSWATNTKRSSCAAYPRAIRPTLNSIVGSSGNDAMLSASSSACWSGVFNCSSKRGSASPRAASCCFSIHKAAESSPRRRRNRKVRFPGVPIDSASIASTDAKSCCASAIVVSHTKSSSRCHIVPYYAPQVWLTGAEGSQDVDMVDI